MRYITSYGEASRDMALAVLADGSNDDGWAEAQLASLEAQAAGDIGHSDRVILPTGAEIRVVSNSRSPHEIARALGTKV